MEVRGLERQAGVVVVVVAVIIRQRLVGQCHMWLQSLQVVDVGLLEAQGGLGPVLLLLLLLLEGGVLEAGLGGRLVSQRDSSAATMLMV